jgi:hypothetical protein
MNTKKPTIQDILIEVRNEWLDEMPQGSTAMDINDGYCNFFGYGVEMRFPRAKGFWIPNEEGNIGLFHYVIRYRGKYFDAECIEGVDKIDDLPIVLREKEHRSKKGA